VCVCVCVCVCVQQDTVINKKGKKKRKEEEVKSGCLPDNRRRSVMLSPLLAKDVVRAVKFDVGAGMLANASDELEINPSLRPVGTFQNGPPFYCVLKKEKSKKS